MSTPVSHSPSPWKVVDEGITLGIQAADGTEVATSGGNFTGKHTERDLADARLIAAAPDLLVILKRLMAFVEAEHTEQYCSPVPGPEPTDRDWSVGNLSFVADKAIAKAETRA